MIAEAGFSEDWAMFCFNGAAHFLKVGLTVSVMAAVPLAMIAYLITRKQR